MIDIGSATLAQEPNMADLIRAAEARVALLEAAALELESDSDPDTDSVTCHSVDVGDGTVSLGQPLPSTAQESPSMGVYSSPPPTTTPTPTNYSAGPSTPTPTNYSGGPGGNTFDAVDSVYMSCVFTGQPGTASDTGHTRPVPHSPWASTGQPGTSAGVASMQPRPDGHDQFPGDDVPREYGAPLPVPLHLVSRFTGQPGFGKGEYSGSPHVMPASTGQPGVGQGENDHSAHSSVVTHRIVSAAPTFRGREPADTDVGCNDWTIANNSTGVQRAPREMRPYVLSNPSCAGASTEQSGMSQPMDVDLSGGIGFSTTNTQNFVVNQTNILNESCVFGNVSNQAVANHTAVAVGATMQVAEE